MPAPRTARLVASTLAVLLAVGAPAPAAPRAAEPPSGTSTLRVESAPAGAAVYVDGNLAGFTPVTVPRLEAGRHRLRLVLDGYLENARTVTLEAGEEQRVSLALTPVGARDGERSPSAVTRGHGARAGIVVGLAAAAVAGAAIALVAGGKGGPVAGTVTVDPAATGLVGGTVFTFTLTGASTSGGAPLTASWDFGDGATATGTTTTHTFSRPGTFTVMATVGDGTSTASASASVTVRDLAGDWTGTVTGAGGVFPVRFTLAQSGASASGTYSDEDGTGTVTGTASAPRTVTLTVTQPGFVPFTFRGAADESVSTITGALETAFTFTISRR